MFGEFPADFRVSREKYRTRGLPKGANLIHLRGDDLAELKRDWVEKAHVPPPADLRAAAAAAPSAVHIRARLADPPDLDYLRDTIGVVQALMDEGGVATLAIQSFGWWSADAWRERVFEKGQQALVPELTVILHAAEERGKGLWVHTRGMRQFARSDISVRNVPQANLQDAARLCNALNKLQVGGGLILEGQEINAAGLPAGLTCHHAGTVDDPDFNNVHVEIGWPG